LIVNVQKRLCWVSMLAYGLFTLRVSIPVAFGDFTLTAY